MFTFTFVAIVAFLVTWTNASSSTSVSVAQKLLKQKHTIVQQQQKAFVAKTKVDFFSSMSKNKLDTSNSNVRSKNNNKNNNVEKDIIPRQQQLSRSSSCISIGSSNNHQNSQGIITTISTFWFSIPSIVRYLISGNIGNIAVYLCEQGIYHFVLHGGDDGRLPLLLLPPHLLPHRDTISFFIGYLMAVPVQHISHALLVYGISTINTRDKYITTLIGMYSAMITSCIGSTLLNAALLKYTKIPKVGAFLITVFAFAFLNFFVIGWIVNNSNNTNKNNQISTTLSQEPEESSFYNDEVIANF